MATTMPVKLEVWGQSNERATVTQGEVKARKVSITLVDADGTPYNLDGYTARLYIVESSGDAVFLDASISDGKVIAEIPFLNSPGEASAQVVLTNEAGEEMRITGLSLNVTPSSLDTAEDTSGVVSVIIAAIDELQEKLDNGDFIGPQGPQGVSGVYVGEGEMPAGYNVQIDPSGEADVCITKGEADDRYSGALTGEAAGGIAQAEGVSTTAALHRLAIQNRTMETGTGDKSPDNPYTLTGIAPTQATVCGKNLLNWLEMPVEEIGTTKKDVWKRYGVTIERTDTAMTLTNDSTPWAGLFVILVVNPGQSYSLSFAADNPSGNKVGIIVCDGMDYGVNQIGNISTTDTDAQLSLTVTPTQTRIHVKFCTNQEDADKSGTVVTFHEMQIEQGAASTAYEPYMGQTVTLPTLSPPYGDGDIYDEYDAATGVETRRWKRVEFDGTENWQYPGTNESGKYRRGILLENLLPIPTNEVSGVSCTHYAGVTQSQTYACVQGVAVSQTGDAILIYDNTYNTQDLTAWKSWLAAQKAAGTPVTVVYQLAEPEVTQHDPERIVPLSPVCNAYADQGTVDMVYSRDINLVMEDILARIEALENA